MSIKICEALLDDELYDLHTLITRYHEEYSPGRPFDKTALSMSLLAMKADGDREHTNTFLAYKGEQLVGFLAATIARRFESFEKYAQMHYWYVVEEHRHTGLVALGLLRAYEQWARMNKCAVTRLEFEPTAKKNEVGKLVALGAKLNYTPLSTTVEKRIVS